MTPIKRRALFAGLTIVVALCAATATLLAVDVYLHGRYERSAGFNVWGYRGTPVGRKQPGEFRVVMLGGSTTYGYGVAAADAVPAVLERLLRARTPSPLFTVVNLGYNNEGAYALKPTLEDYRWLKYDLAVLYGGYNDLASSAQINFSVFRRDSPVFRLTGYMPIFPIIFKEKAAAMLHGGDAGAAYRQNDRAVFHASLATRAGAGVLDATADVARALESELGRVSTTKAAPKIDEHATSECAEPWGAYCESVASAVEYARDAGARVLVASQPTLVIRRDVHDAQVAQQSALHAMLTRRFGSDPAVGYADLGGRVDLADRRLSFDGMHLTEEGNRAIAAALVEPVATMAGGPGASR